MGTEATAAMVAQLVQSVVLGQNPGPVELIWSNLYERGYWTKGGGAITSAAMSAIEVALWDIKGKALGVPVYSLFGGPFRDKIDTYAMDGGWVAKPRRILQRPGSGRSRRARVGSSSIRSG